jgi:hypothetical protein
VNARRNWRAEESSVVCNERPSVSGTNALSALYSKCSSCCQHDLQQTYPSVGPFQYVVQKIVPKSLIESCPSRGQLNYLAELGLEPDGHIASPQAVYIPIQHHDQLGNVYVVGGRHAI